MPLDLMEDLSVGKSWLSFARGSSDIDYEHGEYRKEKKKYAGKTYDSVDSIAEFFKQRAAQLGNTSGSFNQTSSRSIYSGPKSKVQSPTPEEKAAGAGDFTPGSYVKHAKYGRGLVLRREGAGESTKLTVTFPGYGQKKLVQKFAGLEKA
jgi:DNA helicase-2/ATP-dependent DNA helicase PcrA